MALFDKKAINYDDWYKTQIGHVADSLEKNFMKEPAKPIKGEKALDPGCGTGVYSCFKRFHKLRCHQFKYGN